MKMKTAKIAILFASLLSPSLVNAWDGYDYERGTNIEIEKGNLVRPGRDIEIYEDGGYKDVEVESVKRSGGIVELEVLDNETGETRTFEMDDD